MDFYFSQCLILHSCHHLFWCTDCLWFGSWKPLKLSPVLFDLFLSFEQFITFWPHKMISFCTSQLSSWNQPFSRAQAPVFWRTEFRIQDQDTRRLLLLPCPCFWILLADRARKYIYVYTHTSVCISTIISPCGVKAWVPTDSSKSNSKHRVYSFICFILEYTESSFRIANLW